MDVRRSARRLGSQMIGAISGAGEPRARSGARQVGYGGAPPAVLRWWELLLLMSCVVGTLGWLGAERDRAAQGNRLYDAGRYDEAVTTYGEGLSDYPESDRLRFNLGAAQYKKGDFSDALATLEKLVPEEVAAARPGRAAPVKSSPLAGPAEYNAGNTLFRLGQRVEEQNPEQAIALYERALLAYKRAMAQDPDNEDPKFNHEFVGRHVEKLQKRLEEERERQEQQEQQERQERQEQQEQQQDEQQGQQQEPEEQPQSGSGGDQDAGGARPEEEKQEAGEQAEESPQAEDEEAAARAGADEETPQTDDESAQGGTGAESQAAGEQRPGGAGESGGAGGDEGGDTMTAADARALIDAARSDEVDPGEIQRRIPVPAAIGEPEQGW